MTINFPHFVMGLGLNQTYRVTERNENVMISTTTRLHFAPKMMYPNPIESSLFKYVRGKTDEYLIRKNENMT